MSAPPQGILVAAGRLFSEFGVAATTVRQIAREAQMSLGGLYHHFASKEAIASELIYRFVIDLENEYTRLARSAGSERERLTELVAVSLRVAAEHPWATETYQREAAQLQALPDYELIHACVLRNEELWHALARAGIRSGEFRADVDPLVFTRLLSESIWLTVRIHREILADQCDVLADEVVKLLVEGYRTPAR